MTKLEEVARAICRADGFDPDDDPNATGTNLQTEVAYPAGWRKWHTYIRHAQVAIKAMYALPEEVAHDLKHHFDDGISYGHDYQVQSLWVDGIDAILSESDRPTA